MVMAQAEAGTRMSMHHLGCTSTLHKQWDPYVLICVQGTGLRCSAMQVPRPQPSFGEKAMAGRHVHTLEEVCVPEPAGASQRQ